MAKACDNQAVHGPYEHTLFLGCTILEFTVSMGLNEQVGTLTVNLAQDSCVAPETHPKWYWDTALTKRYTTDKDPGFMGEEVPIIGIPVYFRVGNFEFCGLVQSWNKINDSSSNPSYSVTLVTPSQILEGTQLIIGDYSGPLNTSLYNVINVFGFAESFGVSCKELSQIEPGVYNLGDKGPDGAVFGTDSGGFGGAERNNNGMRWNDINEIVTILTSATPSMSNNFSPYGRIVQKGVNLNLYDPKWAKGFGVMVNDTFANGRYLSTYMIDLTELPTTPSYFRFDGTTINLLEGISKVCEESGYDYYIELLPVKVSPIIALSGIAKILKIRTISRNVQPALNAISTFVSNAQANDNYMDSSIGLESRNEVTSSLIIGGNKETVYQAHEADDTSIILPYFGINSYGNYIVPTLDVDNYWEFTVETSDINDNLSILSYTGNVTINEQELISAIGGYDTWDSVAYERNLDSYHPISGAELEPLFVLTKIAQDADEGEPVVPRDAINLKPNVIGDLSEVTDLLLQQDKRTIFEWISSYANNYYGKQFAVQVPYTCAQLDTESNQVTISEQPSNDGGWTEMDEVLGIPIDSIYLDVFRNDTNKIGAFANIGPATGLNYSDLDKSTYVIYNDDLYVTASVDSEYVYHDSLNYDTPRAIVSLNSPVALLEDDYGSVSAIAGLSAKHKGADKATVLRLFNKVGSQAAVLEYGLTLITPIQVAFGMSSNTLTYGPWVNVGPPGQMRVEKNEGLVPWEYSSIAVMNLAGTELANASVTNMHIGEIGSITVAGYPLNPLGAELNAFDNGIFAGANLIENRAIGSDTYSNTLHNGQPFSKPYSVFNYNFTWVGTYGPNITSINVGVGPQGIQTTYSLKTFTPKFGKFAQLNANRLRQVGQNRMRMIRDMRAVQLQNSRSNSIAHDKNALMKTHDAFQKAHRAGKTLSSNSPHEVLIGQIVEQNGRERTIVTTSSLAELPIELATIGYKDKAIVSLDSLFSPISTLYTSGDLLPTLIQPMGKSGIYQNGSGHHSLNSTYGILDICLSAYWTPTSFSCVPPEYTEDLHSIYAPISGQHIDGLHLNPFFNPSGLRGDEIHAKMADEGSGFGHGIDIVARSGTGVFDTPISGINMIISSGNIDYQSGYRPMAFKGPMILQSWGYDTDGKPVPNKIDTVSGARSGFFEQTGLWNYFMDDFGKNPSSWPVAPIDFRLDRKRGVWTTPQKENLVVSYFDYFLEDFPGIKGNIAEVIEMNNIEVADSHGIGLIDIPEGFAKEEYAWSYREKVGILPAFVGDQTTGDFGFEDDTQNRHGTSGGNFPTIHRFTPSETLMLAEYNDNAQEWRYIDKASPDFYLCALNDLSYLYGAHPADSGAMSESGIYQGTQFCSVTAPSEHYHIPYETTHYKDPDDIEAGVNTWYSPYVDINAGHGFKLGTSNTGAMIGAMAQTIDFHNGPIPRPLNIFTGSIAGHPLFAPTIRPEMEEPIYSFCVPIGGASGNIVPDLLPVVSQHYAHDIHFLVTSGQGISSRNEISPTYNTGTGVGDETWTGFFINEHWRGIQPLRSGDPLIDVILEFPSNSSLLEAAQGLATGGALSDGFSFYGFASLDTPMVSNTLIYKVVSLEKQALEVCSIPDGAGPATGTDWQFIGYNNDDCQETAGWYGFCDFPVHTGGSTKVFGFSGACDAGSGGLGWYDPSGGIEGPSGARGAQGPTGVQGEDGEQGFAGIQGPVGPQADIFGDCGIGVIQVGDRTYIRVNSFDLDGPGLSVHDECGLRVNRGCNIFVNHKNDDAVSVNTCSLVTVPDFHPDPPIPLCHGKGLKRVGHDNKCDHIEAFVDCGLHTDDGPIKVNTEDLVGDGLKVQEGNETNECWMTADLACGLEFTVDEADNEQKIKVYVPDLAGKGLIEGDTQDDDTCYIDLDIGCGLAFSGEGDEWDKIVVVDSPALAGEGLIVADDGCRIDIGTGCGITISADGISVKASDLAGEGLRAVGDCALEMDITEGCGIDIVNAEISVDGAALAGGGLTDDGNCELSVGTGCGITINPDGIAVNADDLIGDGLVGQDDCALAIGTGCGIDVFTDGIGVNNEDLAGDGLIASDSGCALDIGTGCGITITDNGIAVNPEDLAGQGLAVGAECALGINYGCGLIITQDTLQLHRPDIAGKYLSPSEQSLGTPGQSDCGLDVESVETQIVQTIEDITIGLDGAGSLYVSLNWTTATAVVLEIINEDYGEDTSTVAVTECTGV